jgi:hypothetical protein
MMEQTLRPRVPRRPTLTRRTLWKTLRILGQIAKPGGWRYAGLR